MERPMKYCQGPICHEHKTKDRIRGPKGDKHYATRRRSSMYYGKGNFCSFQCYNDWAEEFSDRAIDHFGRVTEAKRTNCDSAWYKFNDWNSNSRSYDQYYFINDLLGQRIPITKQQYDNQDLVRPN